MEEIKKQIKMLREVADNLYKHSPHSLKPELHGAAATIELLSKKLDEKDCGGWIPCKERLPEDGVDVLVWFEYFRYGEYNRLFQTKGISYTFNGEWSGFVNGQSGWNRLRIIAWQPLPKDYKK